MNPFEACYQLVTRRSGLFAIVFFVLLVLSMFGLRKTHLELDLYEVLDPNFASSVDLAQMRESFGDVNTTHFVFSARHGTLTAQDSCRIQNFFREYSNEDNRIQSWFSPWQIRRATDLGRKLWYFTLLPDPCTQPETHGLQKDLATLDATPWGPLLTDHAHNEFSINVNFSDTENSEGRKKFDVKVIGDVTKALKEFLAKEAPNVDYKLSGQAAFRWHFHKILSKDAIFNIGILLLFMAFFRIFYGTWKSGFFYIGTLLYTLIVLYGTLSWMGFPIDILTNNLFLMTAIAGVADFLFISSAQEDGDWDHAYRTIIFPGFWTTFTTIVGFWSLMISDITAIQRFGFAAGCGALLEWIATFLVLPVALKIFRFQGQWIDQSKLWRPKALSKALHMRPNKKVTLLLTVTLILSLWAGSHLNFADTPTKNFPESHELRQAFKDLHDKRGWESSLYVVFTPQATRAQQEKILNQIRQQPQVLWIESALEFENFMTHGLSQIRREMVINEMKPLSFYRRYWQPDGQSRSMILMRSSSVSELGALSNSIRKLCQDLCRPVGQNEVFREYSTRVSSTLAESFTLSIVIVLITLFLLCRYRGFKNYLALSVSVIWGPLVMIIFLWIFDIPVNLITSVFLAVIVGMTGDNAVQYVFGGDTLDAGIEKRGMASILLTLLLCVSSLTFLGQTLIPMRWLGILFCLGFAASLFGDLWSLKGLLSLGEKTNGQKD